MMYPICKFHLQSSTSTAIFNCEKVPISPTQALSFSPATGASLIFCTCFVCKNILWRKTWNHLILYNILRVKQQAGKMFKWNQDVHAGKFACQPEPIGFLHLLPLWHRQYRQRFLRFKSKLPSTLLLAGWPSFSPVLNNSLHISWHSVFPLSFHLLQACRFQLSSIGYKHPTHRGFTAVPRFTRNRSFSLGMLHHYDNKLNKVSSL